MTRRRAGGAIGAIAGAAVVLMTPQLARTATLHTPAAALQATPGTQPQQTPPGSSGAAAAPQTPPPTAQQPSQPALGDSGSSLRLELRVFDGSAEVTNECKIHLYPKGQRTSEIPVTRGTGDAPAAAEVPVGFYDAQAVRERRGQVVDLRWAEQLLVQRYPDEYGRHLEMINLKPGYGGLQIRPAPSDAAAAKGWTAVAYVAGDATREVGKAVPAGADLLLALPNGRYDVKLTLPAAGAAGGGTQWIRDVEVPADRTRLKTWSAAAAAAAPDSR